MIKYQYQILRYVHDQFTGEFGNIGIVLYAPDKKFLKCKVVTRYARLSGFFGEINGQFLLNSIKYFENSINKIGSEFNDLIVTRGLTSDLGAITEQLLTRDNSALQLTETFTGIDIDPEITFSQLFTRVIEKYNGEGQETYRTDTYAWNKVYKVHFDSYGITDKLGKHVVKTEKDHFDFDKAWKNGSWNCFQPLSFDLKTEETIKNKVYKWSGIIKALESATEKLHLYLLTTSPEYHHELEVFIKDTLTIKEESLSVEIIKEDKAEDFAANVRREMEASALLHPKDDSIF